MKHLYILLIALICIPNSNTYAQGCDPLINGFSFSVEDCLNDEVATLTVQWGMSGINPSCSAPANSFAIQINLPVSGVYGVNSVADVTSPSSFDWSLIDPFTLEGINNQAIDWLDEGAIVITISPKVVNACALITSNTNISIFGSGPPFFGNPASFNDDDSNNTLNDQLGVTALVPVKLVSFNATNVDCDQNELSWATGSEINNAGFEVQRSIDAINFEEVGFVEPTELIKEGVREYRFVDRSLEGDRQYFYRIKQIDLDGQFEIFEIKVVQVTCGENIKVTLFPNPAVNELNVKITGNSKSDIDVTVHSVDGKLVKRIRDFNSADNKIDISDLNAGMFLLKIKTESEIIEENFIKIK